MGKGGATNHFGWQGPNRRAWLTMRKFLFPGSEVISDEHEKAAQKKYIIQDIPNSQTVFGKQQSVVNAEGHIDHHPHNSKKNRPGNFAEKCFGFGLNAAHKILSEQKLVKPVQFIKIFLNSDESPLNTLKSTLVYMPFTLPFSLCCQKLQLRAMRGCSGCR